MPDIKPEVKGEVPISDHDLQRIVYFIAGDVANVVGRAEVMIPGYKAPMAKIAEVIDHIGNVQRKLSALEALAALADDFEMLADPRMSKLSGTHRDIYAAAAFKIRQRLA